MRSANAGRWNLWRQGMSLPSTSPYLLKVPDPTRRGPAKHISHAQIALNKGWKPVANGVLSKPPGYGLVEWIKLAVPKKA